jgi:3D (Asp-Asp-Asp) domain-containing protein
MAMDPANGQYLYYSTATVFYKSSNGGANWTTKRLPTSRIGTALMVSAKDPNVIYLGTLQVK